MPITLDGTNGITQAGEFNSDSSFGFKNRIINGAMTIDQRNAGASVTPSSSTYTLDRWYALFNQASKFSVQQDAGAVTPPVGFSDYLGVTSTSSYTVGSTDYLGIVQRIEGYNTADLGWGTANAKTVTLSFWVRSSLTGTFGGAIVNNAGDRSYPFTYTISSANTWTQASVTIAGETTGTWSATNSTGIQIFFGLGVGSTYSGTAGSWASTLYWSATGATSVVGTNGATWYVTGVQLEVGSTATSFDYRPYGTELQLCQRYYEILTYNSNGEIMSSYLLTSTFYKSYWYFKVNKRASPTITLVSGSWSNQTPSVNPQIEAVLFRNASGYFFASGTDGNVGLSASSEL
jgi:hypothetical protein